MKEKPFKLIKVKIVDKLEVSKDIIALRVVAVDKNVFKFIPGQFATFKITPKVARSYSMASMPNKKYMDFYADIRPNGVGSQFFMNAKEGDIFEMLMPLGNFVYKEEERPAYFFATGVGVTPFVSMIEYALNTLKTKRKLVLYNGFRYEDQIFCDQDFKLMDLRFDNFDYIVSLTRPTEEWHGEVGRIDKFIQEIKDTNIDCYICGKTEVVEDLKNKLLAIGIPEKQIYYENY